MPTTFNYSTKSKRYHNNTTGKFVGRVEVRNELDRIIDKVSARLVSLSRELADGEITLAQWQNGIAAEIKPLHMSFAAAANGGFGEMSDNDWDRVSGYIKSQLDYLQRFAGDVYTGRQAMDGMLGARATLYAEAARTTYHAELHRLEVLSGATEEMNILGGKDHCNGCLDATAKGWVPIDTLPPIGTRDCVSRCRCNIVYRDTPTDSYN